jgi:hypothetical protein
MQKQTYKTTIYKLGQKAFHYLSPYKSMPPPAKLLLGLLMKFIPTPEYTMYIKMPMLDCPAHDLTVKAYLVGDMLLALLVSNNKQPKLHVRSEWTPPP